MKSLKIKIIFVLLIGATSVVQASFYDGLKKIYLVSSGGELTHIANVAFELQDNKIKYSVTLVDKPFDDHFLSMRPFKCIKGKIQVMCYVPYPYEKSGFISHDNLTELSYDLLFLHKSPAEYGINLWNGVFYQLKKEADRIVGLVYEVDMNTIASPPETDGLPFTEDLVFEADLSNYVYPRLLIQ